MSLVHTARKAPKLVTASSIALACCTPHAPGEVVTLAPAAAAPRTSAADAPLTTTPVLLGDLACTWNDHVLTTGAAPLRLCDRSGAHCFLEAVGEPFQWRLLTLSMSSGERPAFAVQLTYGGMTVQGFAQPAPRLFATEGGAFAGGALALEGGAGHVRIGLLAAGSASRDVDVACDGVAPSPQCATSNDEACSPIATFAPDPAPGMRCPWPLRLYARFRGGADERPTVLDIGVIEDGATFTVVGPIGRELVEVALRHDEIDARDPAKRRPRLRLTEGASLAVKAAALRTCARER